MKTNLPSHGLLILIGVAALTQTTQAQQQGYPQAPGYPQQQYRQPPPGYQQVPPPQYPPQGYAQPGQTQYVSPMQFLPTFGRKFGDMFRRVFYGDTPPAGYSQPQYQQPQYQAPQYQQPTQRLDQPPPGYYQQPAAPQYQVPPQSGQGYPRYETPPPPRSSTSPALPPTSRMNSGSSSAAPSTKKNSTSSTKKPSSQTPQYTPPAITRESVKPNLEEEPPPNIPSDNTPSRLPGSKPEVSSTDSSKNKEKPNASASSGSFLRGKKTGKEGRVISPYPPYRELDVGGLASGSLALDPTTQKVFEVP